MALVAEGVKVERGGRLALAAPDFRVEQGEAAVVTGPNGAGKSTLLRAVAGLVPLSAGRVWLDGAEAPADEAAYAGHLDAVKPALSARANLVGWAAIYGGGGVDEALERFGLAEAAEEPAGWLSAGRKRRLGLARLMVTKRRLWLLDEPTVSLDAASVAIFAALVAEHCAAGGITLAATHVALGLPPGPEIRIEPPRAAAAAAADPFLSGAWA